MQYPAEKRTYYVQWALYCVQHYDISVCWLIAQGVVSKLTLYSFLKHGHDWCVCLPVWGCVWRHNCPEPPFNYSPSFPQMKGKEKGSWEVKLWHKLKKWKNQSRKFESNLVSSASLAGAVHTCYVDRWNLKPIWQTFSSASGPEE